MDDENQTSCSTYFLNCIAALLFAALVMGLIFLGDPEIDRGLLDFVGVVAFVSVIIYGSISKTKKPDKSNSINSSPTRVFPSYFSQYPENWSEITAKVCARDGYKCGNCGSTTNIDVHHIVPLSQGGTHELGNLRTLCHDCHKKIHPYMK